MQTVQLERFLADVEARKASRGVVEDTEALRNKGARRTPAKRELLRRAEERARTAAGR
jgi:hypothetical protein